MTQQRRAANPPYKLPPPIFDARCKACWFTAGVVVLVVDLAHDLFEHILDGDQSGHATVLVHHDRHVDPPGLHLLEQFVESFRLRDEERFAQDFRKQAIAPAVGHRPE